MALFRRKKPSAAGQQVMVVRLHGCVALAQTVWDMPWRTGQATAHSVQNYCAWPTHRILFRRRKAGQKAAWARWKNALPYLQDGRSA